MSIASQLSFSTATSVLAGTAGALLYQSAANTTAFLTIGTNGYVLTSNGSVPGWSLASGITSGASTQVQTVLQSASASYYPMFVDSNNATATAESVYTTSSFYINPFNGALNLGGTGGFSLAQPTPITFANGQQIKDNGGGGLTIVSSNAINLSSVVGNGGITMSPTTTNYAQQSSALLSVNGSIHATEYLISAASSQQASGAKIQRVYTTNAVAGSIYPLGIWNDTEGAVALEIQVSSETSANSGSTTYRWQGGYASVASTGTYYRLFPFNEGRGHGDGADTGLNLNAWGAYVYKTDDYTYGIAVSVPAGRTAKTLVTTISELKRGMTYVAGFNTATTVWTTGTSVYSHKNLIVETLVTATTGYFNGTVTANSFVGAFTGAVTGASTQVQTVLQTASASYFPTFVDSNNVSATGELVYTTSTFTINPSTGVVGIGGSDSGSPLTVKALSTLTGAINSFQKIFTTQANGGLGNNVYVSEWRRRRAAGTDWTTQNIHDGIWVDASFTTPMTDTRTWWDRDPNTPSQAWGDQATTWMFANSTALFLTGGSSQLNTGFTNRLNVTGSIVAGTATSTNGSIILQGQYGTGAITVLGTEYSSGGPVLSYGAYPSNAASAAFFSSSGAALTRAAYTQNGNTHQWYVGASQTVAIGSAVTMTNPMTLNANGLQALSLGIGTTPSGTTGEIRATNEITAYYSSDIRLKENIRLISNPITIVEQIRGVYFDWTDEHIAKRGGEDGYFVRKHDIGVIAQEVEAVLPDLVAERDDGTKVVKYEKLVALLIEAIKEQQKQINQISQALENMVNK